MSIFNKTKSERREILGLSIRVDEKHTDRPCTRTHTHTHTLHTQRTNFTCPYTRILAYTMQQHIHTHTPIDHTHAHTHTHTQPHTHTHTPVKPGAQVQSWAASLPATELEFDGQTSHNLAASMSENLPASHWLHAAEPMAALCVPGAQGRQGPPSEPVYPPLHLQSVSSSLPVCASVFEGQLEQSADPGLGL